MLMTVGPERDLGTPAVESVEEVTVSIDGMPVSVPSGTTVMRAAAIAGVDLSEPLRLAIDKLKAA